MNLASTSKPIFQDKCAGILTSPILIIGAAHSGKSELAASYLKQNEQTAVFGTAIVQHADVGAKIADLKASRPSHWRHYEEPLELTNQLRNLPSECKQVLIDSINQWLASVLITHSNRYCEQQLEAVVLDELARLTDAIQSAAESRQIVCVTSEVGAGIVPSHPIARNFRQLCGKVNIKTAAICKSVVLVSAGLPLVIKS
jgi:adenosylcobinamide kinase/adenosylcobinamide-phosphate guanylyltransferase